MTLRGPRPRRSSPRHVRSWPISEMAVARVGGRLLGWSCHHCSTRATWGNLRPEPRGGQLPQDRGTEGIKLRWLHRRTPKPVGRAGVFGASEIGVGRDPGARVVASRLAPTTPRPPGAPKVGRRWQGNLSFTKCDLRHTAWAVAAAFKGRISCGCQQQGGRRD
jgi:hypothetical protein